MKTVIMAGGRGTRISELFPDIPKPLIPICGKPVLEWEICNLRDQGFKDFVFTVSYMADKIQNYFGDGSKFGVNIEYFVEETPLGNAGALIKNRDNLGTEPFLLLIADAMFDVDFNRMVKFHKEKGGLVTLFTHPNSHPYDSSLIIASKDGAVESWLTKEDKRPDFYRNRVNAGLQIIDPIVLELFISRTGIKPELVGEFDDAGKKILVDMDRQLLKPLCGKGKIFCYDSPEYCKDMGTPERFSQVSRDFLSGTVKAKNLSQPQKAIFLDRDGTINRHVGYVRNKNDFELLPKVAKAIKKINESGYLVIVITNQPVIARGDVSFEELDLIHNKMETLLGLSGAYIDGLYFCPHHPDKGFKGEISELKFDCDCRKPKPGLIFKAAKDFNIDLNRSWMIGDDARDVGCGKNAGSKTVLLGKDDYNQDLTADDLFDAIVKIFDAEKNENQWG